MKLWLVKWSLFTGFVFATNSVGLFASTDSPTNLCRFHLGRLISTSAPLRPENINYKVFGEQNKETVILIHGLDSAHVTFVPFVTDELSKKYRVVVYDQRGHGQTPDEGEDYSTATTANDLKALMDHLKIENAHLLGHSMGARTALRFIELFPGQVKSLTIEDMDVRLRMRDASDTETRTSKLINYLEGSRATKARFDRTFATRAQLVEALTQEYDGDSKHAEGIANRRARQNPDGSMTLLFRPHVSWLYGSQGNAEDFSETFARLDIPVLVLYPDKDGALDKKSAIRIEKLNSRAQVIEIPNSRHNVHGTNTRDFNNALAGFLDQITKGQQP